MVNTTTGGHTVTITRIARTFVVLAALAAALTSVAPASAAVTHNRMHAAMAAYGQCRTGTRNVFGESAAWKGSVLDSMRFGNGAQINVYYGDQRDDPDGKHVEWWTRSHVRIVLGGFDNVRQVAGILDRERHFLERNGRCR
jgi:hypothetical protein